VSSNNGAVPVTLLQNAVSVVVNRAVDGTPRDGVGDEVQVLSPRVGQSTTFSFGGKAGTAVTAQAPNAANPLTADAMFRALVSTNGTNNIPALGTITSPNIEVFGPDNGPFTVVFFSPINAQL